MTKALEQALEIVRRLPQEMQDRAAQMLLSLAGDDAPVLVLGREEEADLVEAKGKMERGELATEAETRRVLSKYRL